MHHVRLACLVATAVVLAAAVYCAAAERASAPDSSVLRADARHDTSALELRLRRLEDRVACVEGTGQNFSSALNAQTGIFSLIVVAVIALVGFLTFGRVKSLVSDSVAELEDRYRDELSRWREREVNAIREGVRKELDESKRHFVLLRASIDRAFASIHENTPVVAYIWWLRAAKGFRDLNPSVARIALEGAIEALSKLSHRHEVERDMEEITAVLSSLDATKYEVEIKLIREHVERVYRGNPLNEKGAEKP